MVTSILKHKRKAFGENNKKFFQVAFYEKNW